MRSIITALMLGLLCASAYPQSTTQDQVLLAKTRALYDAPFARGLISFDCAVVFDWKQHFVDALGSLPAPAAPTVERLQTVQHRLFVDRSGAVVSAVPKAPDLSSVPHGADLEKVFDAIIPNGINAWLPSSTNVLLPVGPTKFSFEKLDTNYKLTMNGTGVAAQLLLDSDLRLTSGVMELPQSMRFTAEFATGPNGFLLSSLKTGDTTDTAASKEAKFAYTYQTVADFQLPSHITVDAGTPEVWRYALTDCKVEKGIVLKVGPPPN